MSLTDTAATVPQDEPNQPEEPEVPWRRLSVRMLAVHPVREVLRAWPVLIGLVVVGTSGGRNPLWSLGGLGVVVVLGLSRWFTTAYRVSERQVQVKQGLVRRQVLTVPRDRVRTVDITASPLHRVLGLARVTVGTGRSDRQNDGIKLDALTTAEADQLRTDLLRRTAVAATDTSPDLAPPTETVLARLHPGWLRYGPFTLSGVLTVLVVAGFLQRLINEADIKVSRFGPLKSATNQLARTALPVAVLEVLLACAVLVAIFSTAGYIVAFWGFRLTRQSGGTLRISRGLLTSRTITIEERRLRGVELSEPLLLRAVGGARCIAIATGLRVGRGAERGGSMLLPPAPRAEAVRVAGVVLAEAIPATAQSGPATPAAEPTGGRGAISVALHRHGSRARLRRYTRALVGAAVVPAVLTVLWGVAGWPGWAVALSLLLVPIAVLLAADRYRNLGHALSGAAFVVSQGSLVRRRCVLSRDAIIGWNLRQSFFQRRAGLVTMVATTAAGRQRYEALDLPARDAVRLADDTVPGLLTPFLVPLGTEHTR